MATSETAGHRQRLRERFLAGTQGFDTDEALLELLLTYAIPQRDVLPLVKRLLAQYGTLASCLDAPLEDLCRVEGIKSHSAVLLKLVARLAKGDAASPPAHEAEARPDVTPPPVHDAGVTPDVSGEEGTAAGQESLWLPSITAPPPSPATAPSPKKQRRSRKDKTGLFTKALVGEAVNMLPLLPDTSSLDEVREFLDSHLHFSAAQTRRRYANYIIQEMFPDGMADTPLRVFAQVFAGTQALREVCFYRFLRAQPLECDLMENLFLAHLGVGRLSRAALRAYLGARFPDSNSISDAAKAVVDALTDGGIATADATDVCFAYRDIPLPSFAFIVHSEFPEPGIFDMAQLEQNSRIRAMLWNPEALVPNLYDLRNQGLIGNISDIDGVRQFSTKYTLAALTNVLCVEANPNEYDGYH